MALSKEEKKQRRVEREREESERHRRWPGASLRKSENYGTDRYKYVDVRIEGGVSWVSIKISKGGKWTLTDDDGSERIWLRPDPEEILKFIHALAVRYNAAVGEMNGMAAEIHIPALREIWEPDRDPMGQA